MILTATQLACKALSLPPVGLPAERHAVCRLCGAAISPGDLVGEFDFGPNFMDDSDLCGREAGGKLICGSCVPFTTKRVMGRTQFCLFTQSRTYVIAKMVHKKWVLENMPEPPLVMVLSDTTLSHMVWRTPVTRSKHLIFLRIGGRLMSIRLSLALEAAQACKTYGERVWDPKKSPKPPRSPFQSLDLALRDPGCGLLSRQGLTHVSPAERNLFSRLRLGEFWALSVLTSSVPAEEPPAVNLQQEQEPETL